MASPLPTAKQSVSLASSGQGGAKVVRGSRIRRDPPPVVKEVTIAERDERDTRTVVIGILTFAVALVIILVGIGSFTGWTPRDYIAHL